jgi:hypothetical protein
MKEIPLKIPVAVIRCRVPGTAAPDPCNLPSVRVGTQDECDVYVCPRQHITRIRVGAPREEYHDEDA